MEFSSKLQAELIAVAQQLADVSVPIAKKYFRSAALRTENKLDQGFDPVTQADREIEQQQRAVLARLRPEDAILGEEFPAKPGSSGLTWVLDPIDGTRAFISGTPTWGTLIAVGPDSGPVLGVVAQPHVGEVFIGGFGSARLLHGGVETAIRVRECAGLEQATLFTTFPEVGTPEEGSAFARVAAQAKLTRYGLDCYAYALVACGQVDLVIEAGLNAYDIQGPMALIQAAGGIVTDWQGGPAHEGGQVIAAGDARVHAQALEILNG